MVLFVLVNIVVTFLLLGILNINRNGMESMEFISDGELLRFLGESDMGDVFPVLNTVGGLPDQTLEVSGMDNNEVFLRISPANSSYISVGPSGMSFVSEKGFTVRDPKSGKVYFSTDFEEQETLPEEVQNLEVKQMTTNRLTGDINERFRVESPKRVTLRGSEGVIVNGKDISIDADGDIELASTEGHIQFVVSENGGDYILGRTKDLPRVPREGDVSTKEGYKVCVCSNSGLIFAVPGVNTCEQANEDENPCA